jgi:hypothetical protein
MPRLKFASASGPSLYSGCFMPSVYYLHEKKREKKSEN